jgi:type 1 fimbriae regulatory protein FimB/type 1 fimbriae regulatory protein FimE
VPPKRVPNSERRPREYLTPGEVKKLIEVARKRGFMILVAYRHGHCVSELRALTRAVS